MASFHVEKLCVTLSGGGRTLLHKSSNADAIDTIDFFH